MYGSVLGACLVAALVAQLTVAAHAAPPPASLCHAGPPYAVWVTATVIATDPRTARCTVGAPAPGPGPGACLAGSGEICLDHGSLTVDGVDVPAPVPACGLAPGLHAVAWCGVDCGHVAVVTGATTAIHTTLVAPRLTVRVERVLEGDPTWRGRVVEGTLTQRTYVGPDPIVPSSLILEDLVVGEVIELRWPAGTPRAFTWLPGCHPALRRPAAAPGCTRCTAGSPEAGSLILVGLIVTALLRRSRR